MIILLFWFLWGFFCGVKMYIIIRKGVTKKFLCIFEWAQLVKEYSGLRETFQWLNGRQKQGWLWCYRQNFDVVSITHQAIILPHPNDWIDLSETDRYVYYSIGKCKTVTTWVRKVSWFIGNFVYLTLEDVPRSTPGDSTLFGLKFCLSA